MISTDVNYLAVLVSAIMNMAVGAFWYSPAGFGKQWAALMGWTDPAKLEAMKKGATKGYIGGFIAALVMMFVLANLVSLTGAATPTAGALVGFWSWLGFVATTQIGVILWDNKPPKLFAINTGYSLVTLVIAGVIMALWP